MLAGLSSACLPRWVLYDGDRKLSSWQEEILMPRQNLQPEALSTRIVQGHVLYSHVVAVEGRRTIFIAGQLARDRHGNVVGKGDMRAQIRQVGENLKAALAAAGATLND